MIEINLIAENEQDKIEITDKMLALMKSCAESVLITEGLEGSFEISLTITDNESIRQINNAFRGIDKETDVLSFPLSDDKSFPVNMDSGDYLLGDIVISAEKAAEQAEEYCHSREREFGFLTVHSVLHLLGYDHVNDEAEGKIMQAREKEALERIGLTRE